MRKPTKSLFVFLSLFLSQVTFAALSEVPLKGNEKLLISVPEAVINLQANPGARSLRIQLVEGAQEDFQVTSGEGLIEIKSKETLSKEDFGKFANKKRVIEIQGPPVALEIHAFEGQVNLNKWNKEALVHLQKGRILVKDSSGTLKLHSQTGDITILDHSGKVEVDTYKSVVAIRGLMGDADVQNFSGETAIERAKGFISLNQGLGSAKILTSQGTLQFELTRGVLSSQAFNGRVEGTTQEGPVNVLMANEGEVNIRSQSGKVTVQSPANSGAALSLTSVEGDIYVPSYLKVSRDGSQKSLRGRLKGDTPKGSIIVRSQDGSIIVK